VKESQAVSRAQSEIASSERLKLKLASLEEELESVKKHSLSALEAERNRCSEEIERMREAFGEKLSEGHEREVALSKEISELQVLPPSLSL
jgi:biopolymer transport protein ExbB/TolQ